VKKSQVKDYLLSQNPLDEGLGFVFPESQDAAVIDLEMEIEKPMTKDDFSLLSTTLDSIANRINVLSNEVSNHTGIILRKMEEMMAQRPVQKKDQAVQTKHPPMKRKAPETDPCYICGETGHWAPQCPEKMNKTNNDSADKKTKQKDPCYKCGQLGHWISECPNEDFVMPPVPGSSHPHVPTEYLPSEMWNPEPPTEEPPKKRRKLSRSKVEKNCKKNCVLWTLLFIRLCSPDLLCLFIGLCTPDLIC
jgi:hypothetical protein